MLQRLPHRFVLIFCVLFSACQPATHPQPKPVLNSASQLAFYTNAQLKGLASTHDSLMYQPADYQLTIYRLTYQTTLEDGTPVVASGVLYVPSQLTAAHKPYPLLSYQHPTAFSDADVPSGGEIGRAEFSYPLYFATHGYLVACPDYIGYGITDHLPHRYEHRQTLAQATVDMLLATQEFLAQQRIDYNRQVFLTGYSEGGYASLSAQKLIEDQYASNLPLAGSSCGAGPYAMSSFFDHITHQSTVGGVANYLYVWQTLAYDRIYKLNKPVSYYFKAPYAGQIAQSLDTTRTISLSFDALCTDQFRADVRNPSSAFSRALADDDLTNWATQTPTRLVHSEQDEIIPFLVSQQAFAALTQRGSKNLHMVALKQGYHVPTEVIAMRRSLEWFQQLRQ